jgi:hypothetical protein
MRTCKILSICRWLVLSSLWLWAASEAQVGRTLVLDDFESADSVQKWEGGVQLSQERSSHGAHSAQVRFEPGHTQISTAKFSQDWRSYDRLLFDIYSDRDEGSMAGIRIYDAVGGDAGQAKANDYYEARGKILVQKGWNHVEVKLQPVRAASD